MDFQSYTKFVNKDLPIVMSCYNCVTIQYNTIQYNTENFYSAGILGVAKFKGA